MRWRLFLSFAFGAAPVWVAFEGIREGASTHSCAIAVAASYPFSMLLCMLFAQDDGIRAERDRHQPIGGVEG